MKNLVMGLSFWLLVQSASGLDVRISLPLNPPMVVDETHGPLVEFARALIASSPHDKITITGVFPFPRSVQNVVTGRADLHFPLIRNPLVDDSSLPYDFTTQSLGESVFVLYTIVGGRVYPGNLGGVQVEVEPDHQAFFPGIVQGEMPVDAGLKRVSAGNLDGYLCSMTTGDEALRRLGLTNLKRWKFRVFQAYGILAKGTKGGPVDQWFTRGFQKALAQGRVPPSQPFVDW